jgi:hypothetical protein
VKIIPLKFRDVAAQAYQEAVTALKQTAWRRQVTTKQEPSTEATLARDPSKDAEHFNRPLPTNWKANPNAKTVAEMVNERPVSDVERFIHNHLQRREDRNAIGQVELDYDRLDLRSKKEKAVSAFMAAIGTGKRYWELTKAEKQLVRNYFIDWTTDRWTPVEITAVVEEKEIELDSMMQRERAVIGRKGSAD